MVHALEEVRRVLKPGGWLLDIRPVEADWPVEVAGGPVTLELGFVDKDPDFVLDDEASERSLAESAQRGWFVLEQQDRFSFNYYWDTPSEMKKYVEEEWEAADRVSEEMFQAAQGAWASAGAEARMRTRRTIVISRWRKT